MADTKKTENSKVVCQGDCLVPNQLDDLKAAIDKGGSRNGICDECQEYVRRVSLQRGPPAIANIKQDGDEQRYREHPGKWTPEVQRHILEHGPCFGPGLIRMRCDSCTVFGKIVPICSLFGHPADSTGRLKTRLSVFYCCQCKHNFLWGSRLNKPFPATTKIAEEIENVLKSHEHAYFTYDGFDGAWLDSSNGVIVDRGSLYFACRLCSA